ncbi:MAG: hypothetical protein ACLFUH_01780 [Bacteroidales bacterium]
MKLKLKRLKFSNFKGGNVDIEFGEVTELMGKNRTGKTRVMDAWLWLLFGKDSDDRTDFSIKPIKNGKVVNRADVIVYGVLEVDGKEMELQKIFREKWQKKKGDTETRFTGHETKYYLDGILTSATEYNKTIHSLVNEDIFKLISSTNHFHRLNWKQRRSILFNLINDISEAEILSFLKEGNSQRYQRLEETLNKGHDVEAFRKMMSEKKKKWQKELDDIPPRISELKRDIEESIDIEATNKELKEKEGELSNIDSKLNDIRKSRQELDNQFKEKYRKISEIKKEIADLKDKGNKENREYLETLKDQLNELKSTENSLMREYESKEGERGRLNEKLLLYQTEINDLVSQYKKIRAENLDVSANDIICPICDGNGKINIESAEKLDGKIIETKGITEEQKQKAIEDFNENKAKRLEEIDKKGREARENFNLIKTKIQEAENKMSELQGRIDETKKLISPKEEKISELEKEIQNKQHKSDEEVAPEKVKEIERLNKEIDNIEFPDVEGLQKERSRVLSERDELNQKINRHKDQERKKERIEELESEMKKYSQEIANLEKQETVAEEFVNKKIELLEKRVNELFEYVKFQMFDRQINGQEVPTCITIVEGVPYPDVNNGNKIIAGLDVIKTLSRHYGVYAPIFIDNKESITDFPYESIETQLVNLVVDQNTDQLQINVKQ